MKNTNNSDKHVELAAACQDSECGDPFLCDACGELWEANAVQSRS